MKRALILVDIQNDFLPGGALAVPDGDKVIEIANKLGKAFDLVIKTQDWHPANHKSFAKNHDLEIGTIIDLNGLSQFLWPVHCVQGSKGAEFSDALDSFKNEVIFQKGGDIEVDSYSGFFDNGKRNATGLGDFLKEKNIEEVFVMGLATDYCVKFTTLDALDLGFKTHLIIDGCRGVNITPGDVDTAVNNMQNAGAILVQSSEMKNV